MESEVSWLSVVMLALLLLLCQMSCASASAASTRLLGAGRAPAAPAVAPSAATSAGPGGPLDQPGPSGPPGSDATLEHKTESGNSESHAQPTPPDVLEDASLSVPKLLKKYGYPVENHVVMTDDGYVLTLHRIPHGRELSDSDDINCNRVRSLRKAPRRRSARRGLTRRRSFTSTGIKSKRGASNERVNSRPVLLLPGMFCSSAVWLLMGPKKSLGYILADAGYDVWISNPRGVRYSVGHVEYPATDDKFWQFSWHEMGEFDVPAVLDYVTAITDQDRIPVVGHSMGNTMMMVMGSVRPEFNRFVSVHIAMAPTVFLEHAQSPVLKGLAALAPTVDTMFPVILGHVPSGGSMRTALHYVQSYTSGDFRQYDLGVKRNLAKYGRPNPPAYNISKVDFPVALLVGENDWLDPVEDVERMSKILPNVIDFYRVPWPKFNHMDHLFAIDIKELEYDHVMTVLERFS